MRSCSQVHPTCLNLSSLDAVRFFYLRQGPLKKTAKAPRALLTTECLDHAGRREKRSLEENTKKVLTGNTSGIRASQSSDRKLMQPVKRFKQGKSDKNPL